MISILCFQDHKNRLKKFQEEESFQRLPLSLQGPGVSVLLESPSSDVGTRGGLGHGSRVRSKDEGTPLAAPGLRLCASTAGMQAHSLLRELGPRKPPARGQSALGSPRPC